MCGQLTFPSAKTAQARMPRHFNLKASLVPVKWPTLIETIVENTKLHNARQPTFAVLLKHKDSSIHIEIAW